MSSNVKQTDRGRISIYDFNIEHIDLSSSDLQLKHRTGYDDEHLKRLKFLFRQITGPHRTTLNRDDFQSAVRLICQSSKSSEFSEKLFEIYDKNTNGQIDFSEMVEFVWFD